MRRKDTSSDVTKFWEMLKMFVLHASGSEESCFGMRPAERQMLWRWQLRGITEPDLMNLCSLMALAMQYDVLVVERGVHIQA